MPQSQAKNEGRPALEMLEEAFHVLRNAPVSAWICYCAGSFPFIAAFVYFWIDMSHSALARGRLGGLACVLVCLYAWMKCWQSVFTWIIHRRLGGPAGPRWGLRRILRLAAIQTALQPLSLLAVPASICLVLPAGWAIAFFHSVGVYGDGSDGRLMPVIAKSASAARAWFGQNLAAMLVLSLFWLAVLVNIAAAGVFLPYLLKVLFGMESEFSRSFTSMLNTTFLAVSVCLTYLCVNPLVKTYHLLRCFQIESVSSGADVKAELEQFAAGANDVKFSAGAGAVNRVGKISALAVLAALLLPAAAALADAPPAPAPEPQKPAAVRPEQLDRTIEDVINRSKYSWRAPRKEVQPGQQQEGDSFFKPLEDAAKTVHGWFKDLGRWLDDIFKSDKPQKPLSQQPGGGNTGGQDNIGNIFKLLCWLGLLAIAAVAAVVIWRFVRNRPAEKEDKPKPDNKARPDLAKEDVSAEEMPEDGWLDMARDFIAAGDYRLAVRAMYLACLARLSQIGLIRVAKFKSNHDYRRELARRSHQLPELMPAFDRNVAIFESAWYGLHDVARSDLDEFIANQERMRHSVAQG
ncbi:MAG: DUF4129 domain-containing protein [Planctomycetes bacterium]|nr:DUF4129 domain-containing protein [Planctomycetota bacterium]